MTLHMAHGSSKHPNNKIMFPKKNLRLKIMIRGAMHRQRCSIFLLFASWASWVRAVKPLCRDLSIWRECRIQVGGLAIQGADAFLAALGPTFQEYLTNTYNDTYGILVST